MSYYDSAYICGCGWKGHEPKWIWARAEGFKVRVKPDLNGKPRTEYRWTKDHTEYVCPWCRASLCGNLVLDCHAISMQTGVWPSGKPKYGMREMAEIRMDADPRNPYPKEGLFQELRRYLYTEKKPGSLGVKDFAEEWSPEILLRRIRKYLDGKKSQFTPEEMTVDVLLTLFGRLEELYHYAERHVEEKRPYAKDNLEKVIKVAKSLTRKDVKAYRGKFDERNFGIKSDLKVNAKKMKGPYLAMASLVQDLRMETSTKIYDKMLTRWSVSDLLDKASERPELEEVANVLLGLMEEFGDVSIRATAITAIMRGRYGMWSVSSARYQAFEKSTYKEREWIAQHPEFYENEEFSLDRGKPTADGGKDEWEFVMAYDPVWKGSYKVTEWYDVNRITASVGKVKLPKAFDLVPYNENVGRSNSVDDDSWEATSYAS